MRKKQKKGTIPCTKSQLFMTFCADFVSRAIRMKKRIITLAVTVLLIVSMLAGCNQRQFTRVEVPSGGEAPTQAGTEASTEAVGGAFTFASGIKMGMSIAEVQAAIGQITEITIQDNRKSISNEFSGVFINYSTTKSVIFMFNQETERLEQMQFRCSTESDGVNTAAAIILFDARYGKRATYQGNYRNNIWKSDGVYILLSEINENEYAVTYTDGPYFESRYEEEAAAYQRAQ